MGIGLVVVRSSLFEDGQRIPLSMAHQWVEGDNVSPDLTWSGIPDSAQSVAVTCYDPDAPTTVGFAHWLLFDLAASTNSLKAGEGAKQANPPGSILGFTDFGESQYGGMAPPAEDAPHRYIFSVFALDLSNLDSDQTTTYAKFRFLIRGHVLAEGALTGLFGLGG